MIVFGTGGDPVALGLVASLNRPGANVTGRTWTAFARTGKPDDQAIPHWPSYNLSDRATLIFTRECNVANDYGHEGRLLWKEIARV